MKSTRISPLSNGKRPRLESRSKTTGRKRCWMQKGRKGKKRGSRE